MANKLEQHDIAGLKGMSFNPTRTLDSTQINNLEEENYNDYYELPSIPDLNSIALRNFIKPAEGTYYLGAGDFGRSKYDETEGPISEYTLNNVLDTRASEQSGFTQIANGLAKMGAWAGTTLVSTTIGTLAGLGQGIVNTFDDNPNTNFVSGLWNNGVTRAMSSALEYLDKKVFPNYYSQWEQNAPWYQRLGTANFWGDGVLKNMGFMAGTAASMALLGGVGLSGSLGTGVSLLKAGQTAKGIGEFAKWAGITLLSAHGEAAVEAINSTKGSMESLDFNMNRRKSEIETAFARRQQLLNFEELEDRAALAGEINKGTTLFKYNDDNSVTTINNLRDLDLYYQLKKAQLTAERDLSLSNLDLAHQKVYEEAQSEITAAGNTIYGLNLAFLALSNNLNMSSLIKGGYSDAESVAKLLKRYISELEVKSVPQFAEAALQGVAKYGQKEISNLTPKTISKGIMDMAVEGLLEGVQSEISTTSEMLFLAKTNRIAEDTILGAELNPNISAELVDYGKAALAAYKEQFGTAGSRGWEEVFIGALSAGIGMPTFKRIYNEDTDSYESKFRWNTAFTEAYDDLTLNGRLKLISKLVNSLNEYILGPDSLIAKNFKHAAALLVINRELSDALEREDIKAYKNALIKDLVEKAFYFRDLGLMSDFTALLDLLETNISDETLDEIIALTTESTSGKSPLSSLDRNTLKQRYAEYARSTKLKVNLILDNIDYFENEEKRLNGIDAFHKLLIVKSLAYKRSLLLDSERRLSKLKLELAQIPGDDAVANTLRKQKELGIAELEKQVDDLKEQLEDDLKNPKKLIDLIDRTIERSIRAQLIHSLEDAVNQIVEAKSMAELLDIYNITDPLYRSSALETAKNLIKDLNKKNTIQQLQNFLSDIDALKDIVDLEYSHYFGEDQNLLNIGLQLKDSDLKILKLIADSMLDNLEDDNPDISRKNLLSHILEAVDNLRELADSYDKNSKPGLAYTVRTITIPALLHYVQNLDRIDEVRDALEAIKKSKEKTNQAQEATLEVANVSLAEVSEPAILPAELIEKPLPATLETPSSKKDNSITIDGFDDLNLTVVKKDEIDALTRAGKTEEVEAIKKKTKELINAWNLYVGELGAPKTSENIDGLKKVILLFKEGAAVGPTIANTIKKAIELERGVLESWYNDTYKNPVVITPEVEELPEEVTSTQPEVSVAPVTPQDEEAVVVESAEEAIVDGNGRMIPELVENDLLSDNTSGEGFRGNTFPKYVHSLLRTGVKLEVTHSNKEGIGEWLKLQVWYSNILTLIDNYLKNLPKDTEIKYLHVRDHDNVILLAIKNTEEVKKVIPNDTFASSIVETNDGLYIIIGTMGVESMDTPIANNFNNILNKLNELANKLNNLSYLYFVDTEHTNNIKATTEGSLIIKNQDGTNPLKDLAELLQSDETNPHHLTVDSLSFVSILGTVDSPTYKFIHVPPTALVHKPLNNIPGLVYLLVPTAKKDVLIPIFITPKLFGDLSLDTEWGKDLLSDIRTMADVSLDVKVRLVAASNIRGKLYFEKGHYFAVNDTGSVKIMDNLHIEYMDLGTNLDEAIQTAVASLKLLGPRAILTSTVLANNPSYYINSGLVYTDAQVLGTVGANFYIYDVKDDLSPNLSLGPITALDLVEHHTNTTLSRDKGPLTYIEGVKYEFRDLKFVSEDGRELVNTDIAAIVNSTFPSERIITFENDDNTYYKISDTQVIRKHKEGFRYLTPLESLRILNKFENLLEEKERKATLKEEAQKILEQPNEPLTVENASNSNFSNETLLPSEPPTALDKATIAPQSNGLGQTIVNGENAQLLKSVNLLHNSKNNIIFARENRTLVSEIRELINSKYNLNLKNRDEVSDWINKNLPGFEINTREDLENIKNCKL